MNYLYFGVLVALETVLKFLLANVSLDVYYSEIMLT